MTIYTKKGDGGETSLLSGERVSKASARVNAYGDIDELISVIGLLRCDEPDFNRELKHIQEILMLAAAHIATLGDVAKLKSFPEKEIGNLETRIDEMISKIPQQKLFVLPYQPRSASLAHIARSVCRRAERSCVALKDEKNNAILSVKFLNRLSDYFFELGRFLCYKNNISEDFWIA